MWPFSWWEPDAIRQRLAENTPPGPLRDYYAVPWPERGEDYRNARYLAIDLETTGLHPLHDEILSVGIVAIVDQAIRMDQARYWLVKPTREIPASSVIIHQITHDRAAGGRPLREVLDELLPQLAGRVLLAHHAKIERGFLDEACRRHYGGPFRILTVDTLEMARRGLDRRLVPYQPADLRLHALRERFGLPRYRAHHALSDALSAAELFMVQASHRETQGQILPLRSLLTP
ncbi:MAG: exonuclease domain-containing protein [Pseudomonadota bacterium]